MPRFDNEEEWYKAWSTLNGACAVQLHKCIHDSMTLMTRNNIKRHVQNTVGRITNTIKYGHSEKYQDSTNRNS